MLPYVTGVEMHFALNPSNERIMAYFMNKLRTTALCLVCLFCFCAYMGIVNPSYVEALTVESTGKQDTEERNSQEELSISGPDLNSGKTNNGEKVEFVTETRMEKIPYGTTEVGIDTIPKGSRQVAEQGIEGQIKRTYLVKYVDGKKVDEAIYTEFPISNPVNEIVNVGVGGTVTAKDGTVYEYNYRRKMEATAYTYVPGKTTMTTATGQRLRKGIVAVDPREIPLHTKMFITGSVEYGLGVAEDTGGVIKGNIIDLAYMSYDECIQFGRRQMQVYFLD